MVSLGTPLENEEGMKPSPLVELNPNMLVRDVERIENVAIVAGSLGRGGIKGDLEQEKKVNLYF